MVTRGGLETIRLKLVTAVIALRMAGGVLEFDTIQKIQGLSDA